MKPKLFIRATISNQRQESLPKKHKNTEYFKFFTQNFRQTSMFYEFIHLFFFKSFILVVIFKRNQFLILRTVNKKWPWTFLAWITGSTFILVFYTAIRKYHLIFFQSLIYYFILWSVIVFVNFVYLWSRIKIWISFIFDYFKRGCLIWILLGWWLINVGWRLICFCLCYQLLSHDLLKSWADCEGWMYTRYSHRILIQIGFNTPMSLINIFNHIFGYYLFIWIAFVLILNVFLLLVIKVYFIFHNYPLSVVIQSLLIVNIWGIWRILKHYRPLSFIFQTIFGNTANLNLCNSSLIFLSWRWSHNFWMLIRVNIWRFKPFKDYISCL